MSTAIIGRSSFAAKMSGALELKQFCTPDAAIAQYDTLLLADEPVTFPQAIAEIAPFMKAGQAVIVGCGSIYGTWTVSKALYNNKAPDRIIVGMCDAWSGSADNASVNTQTALVSAHNFIYTPLLAYLLSEVFENVETAASPLALSFRAPGLINELLPIAKQCGCEDILSKARSEALEIGLLMGTVPAGGEEVVYGSTIDSALNAAVVCLYPLTETAAFLGYDAPALSALLTAADEMSMGRVSEVGKMHLPKLDSVISHDHRHL